MKFAQDTYGECRKCGKECRLRCEKCPWVFYCCKEHQLEDWLSHKKNCKIIEWLEDGGAKAGKDLEAGLVILERSTIFVAPRYHTDFEMREMSEDYVESDGPFRPCFGCHMMIPPYFNVTLVCSTCKFPVHNKACETSGWHVAECQILKKMYIQNWYEDIGRRTNIMIYLAVLRGLLLKNRKPAVWTQIISLHNETIYLISEELKNSIIHFIMEICEVDGITVEDIVKFLTIFMKHRLNCTMPCTPNKRLVFFMFNSDMTADERIPTPARLLEMTNCS